MNHIFTTPFQTLYYKTFEHKIGKNCTMIIHILTTKIKTYLWPYLPLSLSLLTFESKLQTPSLTLKLLGEA